MTVFTGIVKIQRRSRSVCCVLSFTDVATITTSVYAFTVTSVNRSPTVKVA
jgi:hypothetical protein